jgi:hypothetical protein
MLALIVGLQAYALGVLPENTTRNQIAGEQFDLNRSFVANEVLNLSNAG